MDKYFIAEISVPIVFLLGFWFISHRLLRKFNKRGARWNFLFSILSLFLMICVWFLIAHYSGRLQCEAAYGRMASEPKMCDNPATGFHSMLQVPIIFFAWLAVAILAAFKNNKIKQSR